VTFVGKTYVALLFSTKSGVGVCDAKNKYMLNKLSSNFDSQIYIQIWENRIKATNIETGKIYDEKPLLAISLNDKGENVIEAVGNDAHFRTGSNIEVINPFSHERSLISNFEIGEKLLQHIIGLILPKGIFKLSPRVVVHPMEKLEGGLTTVEERAFKELAIGAGAREAIVYQGSELAIPGFNYDNIK